MITELVRLTYDEWDALCSKMERAFLTIPGVWPMTSYEGIGLMDEIGDVHGELMTRPTQPSVIVNGF